MSTTPEVKMNLQDQLSQKLMAVVESELDTQRKYWDSNSGNRPGRADLDSIINKHSNNNALIAGAFNLVPGPWGMLAAVPEIILVIRNQIKMVYEIGVALGKTKVMTKELLLGILLSATGSGAVSLLAMHGGKLLVKRQSLRVFQKIVAVFAGKVTQQLLKSSISKYLPVVGAIAMATWARFSTATIGQKAKELLDLPIEVDSSELEVDEIVQEIGSEPSGFQVMQQKIVILANLMKSDGEIAPEELDYFNSLLSASEMSSETQQRLRQSLSLPQQKADFSAFIDDEDERFGLMVDLIAMARRDGEIRPMESAYIRLVANKVGFSAADLADFGLG